VEARNDRKEITNVLTDEAAQNRFVAAATLLLFEQETIFGHRRNRLKQTRPTLPHDQWGNAVMWDIINILYRNYCLARLHEMRKLSIAG
jgi:hypothetical protein